MRKNNVPLKKWEVRDLCVYVGYALVVLTLIILKLAKLIAWSWIWVLAPLWFPALAFALIVLGIVIYVGIQCKAEDFREIDE